MNPIKCPPGHSVQVSLQALNQFGQPGSFAPPVLWDVDAPSLGSFIEDPAFPGDTTKRIFVAASTGLGQSGTYHVIVPTVNGPIGNQGAVQLVFPDAPVISLEVTVGTPFLP